MTRPLDIARDEWEALRWTLERGKLGLMLFGCQHGLTIVRVWLGPGRHAIDRIHWTRWKGGRCFYYMKWPETIGAGGLRRALRRARYEIARERGEVTA